MLNMHSTETVCADQAIVKVLKEHQRHNILPGWFVVLDAHKYILMQVLWAR